MRRLLFSHALFFLLPPATSVSCFISMIKETQELHYRLPVAADAQASLLSLFSPEMFLNRGFAVEGNGNMMSPAPETVYWSPVAAGFPPVKSDSGLTYAPLSRKRQRDSTGTISPPPTCFQDQIVGNRRGGAGGVYTFLGEDISGQIQNQMTEIDRFVAQNTEMVIRKMDERRKHYSRRIAAAVEEAAIKKLKAKEEEIEKIEKFNIALEERLKSLAAENQLWRDLALSNEATANALRSNLEEILAKFENEKQHETDDAESCCGSNDDGRMCRICRKEELSVLLLPCRHLCVCGGCISAAQNCPLCESTITATLHVNRSF